MNIVLVEPLIPQNTGSIARTCAATCTRLHLVGELGFDISEKAVRRAGLDYWPYLTLLQHESWEAFLESEHPIELRFFTKFATTPYWDVSYGENSYLVFGSETTGLGEAFLHKQREENQVTIPMDHPKVRSLNLSNAVSIALYEARRQNTMIQGS